MIFQVLLDDGPGREQILVGETAEPDEVKKLLLRAEELEGTHVEADFGYAETADGSSMSVSGPAWLSMDWESLCAGRDIKPDARQSPAKVDIRIYRLARGEYKMALQRSKPTTVGRSLRAGDIIEIWQADTEHLIAICDSEVWLSLDLGAFLARILKLGSDVRRQRRRGRLNGRAPLL